MSHTGPLPDTRKATFSIHLPTHNGSACSIQSARTNVSMVPERLADVTSEVAIPKISSLRVDNQLFGEWVSLITAMKHMKQTMEYLCKANGATYSMFYPLSFSTLSDLSKISFIAGKAACCPLKL